jgi:hypothetical protein
MAEMKGVSSVSLLEFVKRECANWKNGRCLFGECSVAAGKRCCVSRACLCTGQQYPPNDDYFRACVLPLAATKPEYQRAANKYAANCDLKPMEQRFCECGQPLAARARMCAKCKAVKRRTTVREAVRLRRKAACKQLTPISAPQLPGVQGDKFRNSQGCYPPTGPIAVS